MNSSNAESRKYPRTNLTRSGQCGFVVHPCQNKGVYKGFGTGLLTAWLWRSSYNSYIVFK